MHLSFSLLVSLSTLLLGTTLAQTNSTNYEVRCLRFPPTITGNHTLEPEAITSLSKALADNSYNPPLPADGIRLSPGGSSRVGWGGNGGYQVCLQNFYFFTSVTVPLIDVSNAVAEIADSCCSTGRRGIVPGTGGRQGKCQDAKALITAPDGNKIKLVAQDYGDNCCGMWGCN